MSSEIPTKPQPYCSTTPFGCKYVVLLCAMIAGGVYLFSRGGDSQPSNDNHVAATVQTDETPLVVYCAHDAIFSEEILHEFEQQTGIPVSIRFDTEATKSLGLVNLLISEKDNPRCDVFWNNQVLGTQQLQQAGVLFPYHSVNAKRIPEEFKDADGYWTGFAGRLRVFIVNTNKMQPDEDSIAAALQGDLSMMAVAKPMFGTTLSHYSILWHKLGAEKLQQLHHDMRQRGVREVPGNSSVKNLVAEGVCHFGWTDTDDFFVAQDAGQPVAMQPIRLESGQTICIPNSVAIIQGTQQLAKARRLVDFLLSAEMEIHMANSRSRQVPLGPVDDAQIPAEVQELREWAADAYDLSSVGAAREACLAWLKSEYLR